MRNLIIKSLFLCITFFYSFDIHAQQNKLNCDVFVGDINNDGTDDFIKIINSSSIKIFNSDFNVTPITEKSLQLNSNIVKIAVGNLKNDKTVLMVLLEDNEIHFYDYSTSRMQLQKISQQPNFTHYTNEDILIGDFDGDALDEVLIHNTVTGKVEFFEFNSRNILTKVPESKIRLGNLNSFNFIGKKIIVGEFNGNSDRDDLLIIDYDTKRVHRYSGAVYQGVNEFWWHFSASNEYITRENNIIAVNINGDETDDIVIRDHRSGDYFFYLPNDFLPNGLKPIANVDIGQLPKEKGKTILVKHEDKRKTRDNMLYMRDNWLTLTGAALDTNKNLQTFWWAYTSNKLCKYEYLSPNHIISQTEWKPLFDPFLSTSRLRLNNFTPHKEQYRRGEFEFYKPDDSYLVLANERQELNIGLPIKTGPNNMYKMYINDWNSETLSIRGKPDNIIELEVRMEDHGKEIIGKCHNNFFCGFSPYPVFDYSNSKLMIDIELQIYNGQLYLTSKASFHANTTETGPCVRNFFAMFCPSNRNSIIKTNIETQINYHLNNSAFKNRIRTILNVMMSSKGIDLSDIKFIAINENGDMLFFE